MTDLSDEIRRLAAMAEAGMLPELTEEELENMAAVAAMLVAEIDCTECLALLAEEENRP